VRHLKPGGVLLGGLGLQVEELRMNHLYDTYLLAEGEFRTTAFLGRMAHKVGGRTLD